ncbi:hypothetical protein [Agromyces sp. NBRC 114283]|uniref:hypothetical protein n=1 Tax=Agromyces sp. NBRC 114283 TaxID=2994521 RepID=UPI0024A57864|nr:hypothetical protein [Agromyces sp. NBRC 114283]GLU90297.1 hypothetical protein Agsp01_25520 [Agromyces sp. NBRC 114283]
MRYSAVGHWLKREMNVSSSKVTSSKVPCNCSEPQPANDMFGVSQRVFAPAFSAKPQLPEVLSEIVWSRLPVTARFVGASPSSDIVTPGVRMTHSWELNEPLPYWVRAGSSLVQV